MRLPMLLNAKSTTKCPTKRVRWNLSSTVLTKTACITCACIWWMQDKRLHRKTTALACWNTGDCTLLRPIHRSLLMWLISNPTNMWAKWLDLLHAMPSKIRISLLQISILTCLWSMLLLTLTIIKTRWAWSFTLLNSNWKRKKTRWRISISWRNSMPKILLTTWLWERWPACMATWTWKMSWSRLLILV